MTIATEALRLGNEQLYGGRSLLLGFLNRLTNVRRLIRPQPAESLEGIIKRSIEEAFESFGREFRG